MGGIVVAAHPEAETGQCGGHGRHAERQGLQRSISPRLVIRREDCQVHSHKKVIVLPVEHAIVSVQIRGHIYDLDLAAGAVDQAQGFYTVEDNVVSGLVETVGSQALIAGAVSCELGDQFLVRTIVAGRHHDEGHHGPVAAAGVVETAQYVQIGVDTLVLIFIPAADTHDEGIGAVLTAHGRCQGKQSLPSFSHSLSLLFLGGQNAVVKTVGSDKVHFLAQQTLALSGGNVADSGENIGVDGGASLEGVLGHHVVIAGLLIGVAIVQGLVQRHVVASKAASHDGSVGCENGSDMGFGPLEIKYAGSCHPLVEMSHHAVMGLEVEIDEALYHLSGGIAEQGGLDEVPLSGEGVQLELLPQGGEYLIFLGNELGEIHEDGNRLPGDVPPSHPQAQPLFGGGNPPGAEEYGILGKLRILGGIHPYIRAYVDVVASQLLRKVQRFCSQYGMDAPYLIADFPACLEQIVGHHNFFSTHKCLDVGNGYYSCFRRPSILSIKSLKTFI
ncbi:unknown [Alistipes sp. CAG:831]|nr:unknown [Alistipes sp. CAG:831]